MPGHANDDAAENVDREDDQAGDGVAADEFRGAVHRAEEGALFLELAPARLRHLLVDQAGREIGVDRHLLAGDGVEGEARADFGDAGRALGDDEEVDRHQDQKDDDADEEIAAHDEAGEAADDVAGRGRPLSPVRQNEAGGRDVEGESEDRRDQQHRREGGEFERLLDPQADHQDQHGKGDRQRQAEVDHRRRDGQEEEAEDEDDADGEADVLAAATGGGGRVDCCCGHQGTRRLGSSGARRAPAGKVAGEACARVGGRSRRPEI